MIINRNIKKIEEKAPAFLNSLGFEVIGKDWHGFSLITGGRVSYLIKRPDSEVIYMAWVISWFGEMMLDTIDTVTPSMAFVGQETK